MRYVPAARYYVAAFQPDSPQLCPLCQRDEGDIRHVMYCTGLSEDVNHQFAGGDEYELIGVSNHYGNTGGGHYTAFAKHADSWHEFNDSNTSSVEPDAVITPAAFGGSEATCAGGLGVDLQRAGRHRGGPG